MLSGHMWGMTQKDPGYPDGMFCTLFLGVWGGGGGGDNYIPYFLSLMIWCEVRRYIS